MQERPTFTFEELRRKANEFWPKLPQEHHIAGKAVLHAFIDYLIPKREVLPLMPETVRAALAELTEAEKQEIMASLQK